MARLCLQPDEIERMQGLVRGIAASIDGVEDADFQRGAAVAAHELPRRVRRHLVDFKLREPDALCLISGYPIDQARIGPTPAHWRRPPGRSGAIEEEVLLVLAGSLLGDCIGWATQQDGRVMHDVLPIEGHRDEQLGSGSEQLLWWHTEDAFHPCCGDYIGMLCLRNPDAVATTYASVAELPLAAEQLDLLFEPHYTIRPDNSHRELNRSDPAPAAGAVAAAYERIERLSARTEKVAVLFGDRRSPYIRIDPYFMDPVADHAPAQAALDALIDAIDARLADLALAPGDLCLLDNCRAVHGRRPFKARFDGGDRWLKRINVAIDLRKSRPSRRETGSRIIF